MKPFFTVISPSLNEEHYLPILLGCLANQTFKNFEVIHVDGSSEDKTVERATAFKDRLDIKSIVVKKRNVCFQRNTGANAANGEWLMFIDSDDQIEADFLLKIHDYVTTHQIHVLSTFYQPDTNKFTHHFLASIVNWLSYFLQYSQLPFITESVFIFKREEFLKVGGFDESLKASEGTDITQRAKKEGFVYKMIRSPKYSFSMRRVESQGLLKAIKNNATIGFKMFLGKKMTKDNLKDLYPMEGGGKYK
ncbi:MAG: glycosyltransferase family 2 protein [Pseudomonadales bacterium]|nr:glycosyltransferase family 2 protein [Pseudomonadales bacterium]